MLLADNFQNASLSKQLHIFHQSISFFKAKPLKIQIACRFHKRQLSLTNHNASVHRKRTVLSSIVIQRNIHQGSQIFALLRYFIAYIGMSEQEEKKEDDSQCQDETLREEAESIVYNQSEYQYQAKNSYGEGLINRNFLENGHKSNYSSSLLNNSDSDDDEGLRQYHQLLQQNFLDDEKNENKSLFEQYQPPQEDDEWSDKQSVKSHFSSQDVKSQNSTNKSIVTLDPNQTSLAALAANRDANKEKRKYLKQEARRIKHQLKQEELRQKSQCRQYKDYDLDLDGKRRGKGKNRRRRLTKRTLELLAKKFDQFYSHEVNRDVAGPKISIRQIGQLFDMGNSTIHKLYAQWMQDSAFYQRIQRQNLKRKTPERRVTLQRLEHVARLIKENPFLTQNQLTVELNKIEDLKSVKNGQRVEITRTTVARLLKVGKFKKKRVKCVPKERNTSRSLIKRHEYCTKYHQIYHKKARIYFLDESGFNLYMTRDKAWARPNEQITVNCPISKGKRFSLIAIIADDGLTSWRIIEGTYRKYEYLDFLKQLYKRIQDEVDPEQEDPQQKWLILDNCAIHDKEQTINLGKQCGMNILFLPPYSPQLNPIENWFHEVKAKIRKINYSGEKQLLQIMHRTLKEYQVYDFTNYFNGILKYVEKGCNKEKF